MEHIFAGKSMNEIIDDYSNTLIRVAFQNTKSLPDAEDIVQEVYVKLLRYKGDFQSEEHLKSWLIKVTYHRCKDFFRSAWFRRTVPLKPEMDFMAPEEQTIMEEIFQLKKEDRTIIYLYYYEGYTIREIAVMLGLKENTLSSKLQRARTKLKGIMEEGRDYDGR